MGWKLWQVGCSVGERHGDFPYLSNFTPPDLSNMNSYVYYIFLNSRCIDTHNCIWRVHVMATYHTPHNCHVFCSSKLVGSDEDVCAPPL